MNKYAQLGLDAQAGASNPIGLANALIEAVENYPDGDADATRELGLRAVAHQLVSLYSAEYPARVGVLSVLQALIANTREHGRDSLQAIGLAHHIARSFAVDDFIEGYGENMAELAREAG